mmetsp:Transcript_63565/g.163603  ORF Transcript_63565/g.163603 Transcript_63565/m.163603 type:complete len:319 (+) Transcript_63565:784-1740(+)
MHEAVEDALDQAPSSLRRAATRAHGSVHDGVPILPRHNLEDRHEAPTEIVEVGARNAALSEVIVLVAKMPVVRTPWVGFVALVAVNSRKGLCGVVVLLELKPVGKEVHPHQRADVQDQEEEDEPVPERLTSRHHGLQQDLQRRRARGKLVQHAEQAQRPQSLQAAWAPAVQGDGLLNDRDDDDHAIEAGRRILDVANDPARGDLENCLNDEDEQEDAPDKGLWPLDRDLRWEGLHHHRDHISCDDEHDEVGEDVIVCHGVGSPHRHAVHPRLLLFLLLIVLQYSEVRLDVFCGALLLLFGLLLLVLLLEVLPRLVNDG